MSSVWAYGITSPSLVTFLLMRMARTWASTSEDCRMLPTLASNNNTIVPFNRHYARWNVEKYLRIQMSFYCPVTRLVIVIVSLT